MGKFIVIGLGVFGRQVALTLASEGAEVIAVDSDMERVEEIHDYVAYSVCLDSTDPAALKSLGLQDMDAGIVAIGENFEANVLTAAYLKQIGIPKVITRAANPIHRKILQQIGADEIISPEDEVGRKTAHKLLRPHLMDFMDITGEYKLIRVETPEEFYEKTLSELDLRNKHNVNVISILKKEGMEQENASAVNSITEEIVPDANTRLDEHTILVLIGREEDIYKFADQFGINE